jgi:nucleoside-diphosphate-sugar epimerase
MRYLVTGGGGFLGSELVAELIKGKKNEVYVFDNAMYGAISRPPPAVKSHIVGNIKDFYAISKAVEVAKPDVIFHLAAFITRPETVGEFRMCAEVNHLGTAHLLESCLRGKGKPKQIIFASSEAVRNPTSHYGISKRAAESLLASVCPVTGIKLGILRFSEIYGVSKVQSSKSLVNFLVDNMVVNKSVAIFDANKKKDYVHISDAVRACKAAIKVADPFFRVDIGPGEPVVTKDLVDKLRTLIEFKGEIKYLEHGAVRIVDSIADPLPAKQLLGFECTADFDAELKALIKKRKKDLS